MKNELHNEFNRSDVIKKVGDISKIMNEMGKEGNFCICENEDVSPIIYGEMQEIKDVKMLDDFCRGRKSRVKIDIHTHPTGVKYPTIDDMVSNAQASGKDCWTCIVTGEYREEEIACHRPIGRASEIAERLEGVEVQDEDFRGMYGKMGEALSSYERRWRSFDIADRNIETVEIEKWEEK